MTPTETRHPMTTHAKDQQETQEQHPGAPQSGGMSGVAATPDEGAKMQDEYFRDAVASLLNCLDEWAWTNHRRDTSPHISASVALETMHTHRERLRALLAEAPAPENLLTRVLRHEAEPEDAAALEPRMREYENAAFLCGEWSSADAEEPFEAVERRLNNARRALLAALRRAAPGAAPEREGAVERYAEKWRQIARGESPDNPTPEMLSVIRRLTPAPTGERAGGEALREAVMAYGAVHASGDVEAFNKARYRLLAEARRDYLASPEYAAKSQAISEHVAEALRPAPVAAPRGTEGRHDARPEGGR